MRASKITSIDFFDDLTSPYARKRFFGGFIAIIVLCIILIVISDTLLNNSPFGRNLESVSDNFLSSALIVVFFYVIYMYLIGPNDELRQIKVIRPKDIGELIKQLPQQTSNYIFWGRSGSYFRANTLVELDKRAKADKRVTDVTVILPDPTDLRLATAYNEVVTSLGEQPGQYLLLHNILATVLVCAIINENNKFLNIKVFLSRTLPMARLDLSDGGAILTQDDPAKSAIFFESKSEFFELYRTSARSEINLCSLVQWNSKFYYGKKVDKQSCNREAVEALNITLDIDNFENLTNGVRMLIAKQEHRYT